MANRIFIGTAGWSIPRQHAEQAQGEGTHLQRYAQQLPCAEINSSFYRPHRPGTYKRWADATPDGFRFSVKVTRKLTHEGALTPDADTLQRFLDETSALGDKRGPLLLQLPPKLELDIARTDAFFQMFRSRYDGPAVLEPRHASWFTSEAEALVTSFRIGRVAADPPRVPQAMTPAGDPSIVYYRLHGSPRIYYSDYTEDFLDQLAFDLQRATQAAMEVWCIFDNTASGAALGNALSLRNRIVAQP
jgi:uncharacterized protein YecE (DUF72 family)